MNVFKLKIVLVTLTNNIRRNYISFNVTKSCYNVFSLIIHCDV